MMRQSKMLIPTLREAPAEAEAISHKLLLRAGYIRQVASGIYTYMPLGWRVLNKVAAIVREELNRAEAQEVLMSVLQPAELWQQSGRYSAYGPELMRMQDRNQREFALGPTHEEVVTSLVAHEVRSYRQLPLNLYQIQTKFRDERRPRFGLLRGREFLMKDAYSFDMDAAGLNETYWRMYDAYQRIFSRCGLNVRPVEADAGTIGGDGGTHEFMALADIGEDTIVSCTGCDYAANLEKAEVAIVGIKGVAASAEHFIEGPAESSDECSIEGPAEGSAERSVEHSIESSVKSSDEIPSVERFHTPNVGTIQELVSLTGLEANAFVKTLIYRADDDFIAVLVRGDHEVNEIKLKQAVGAEILEMAEPADTMRITGAPVGFAGPIGLAVSIPIYADYSAAALHDAVVGANQGDYHLRHVNLTRDVSIAKIGDYRNAVKGDCCPRCGSSFAFNRGIEVGQVFKLGTKYSSKLGAVYLDQTGMEKPMVMGCYGIGISRVLSAIVEQHHDDNGIVWPASVSPYQVHIIQVSAKDETQTTAALQLAQLLEAEGVEVLLDDRDERPGVKFKDADLIGIPYRITIGKYAGEGKVEYKERFLQQGAELISLEEAVERIAKQ